MNITREQYEADIRKAKVGALCDLAEQFETAPYYIGGRHAAARIRAIVAESGLQ